jgi:hypothetical protein
LLALLLFLLLRCFLRFLIHMAPLYSVSDFSASRWRVASDKHSALRLW